MSVFSSLFRPEKQKMQAAFLNLLPDSGWSGVQQIKLRSAADRALPCSRLVREACIARKGEDEGVNWVE